MCRCPRDSRNRSNISPGKVPASLRLRIVKMTETTLRTLPASHIP